MNADERRYADIKTVTCVFGLFCCLPSIAANNLAEVRAALARGTGVVVLPAGETLLDAPVSVPDGARQLTLRGHARGSVLRLTAGFADPAAIVARHATGLTLEQFA